MSTITKFVVEVLFQISDVFSILQPTTVIAGEDAKSELKHRITMAGMSLSVAKNVFGTDRQAALK